MNNRGFFNSESNRNRDAWKHADAGSKELGGYKGVSAPFIIQVVNSNLPPTTAISDVDIGDSVTNRTANNFGQDSHISITSTVSGVTYREFLALSESRPFVVGATMIISSTAGQLEQSVGITHKNGSGDSVTHTITPTLTINQKQTDRIADNYEYMFDGFTRFRINSVASGATVTIRIYPKDIYSATQKVAGRNDLSRFSMPNIYG